MGDVNDGGGLTEYYYDNIGRITDVVDAEEREVSYEYDVRGLRTKLTYPDNSYITYEYDALGRLAEIKDDDGNSIAQYSYDELFRRTLLTLGNDANAVYEYDLAIGPADDGGYYLIGFKAESFTPDLFEGIHWGGADVLERTKGKAGKLGLRIWEGITLADIDTLEDLREIMGKPEAQVTLSHTYGEFNQQALSQKAPSPKAVSQTMKDLQEGE